MQCLMTYKWVKLLRSHLPEGKGLMGYWAKLASHAAFRKGQALYCRHYNRVAPGMWSGGMVGLKRILGLKSRQSVIDVMNKLMDLGFITYTIDAKTKKLEYFLCDWIENCSGEACLGVTAYAIDQYGFPIPFLFFASIVSVLIAIIAVVLYFLEIGKVSQKIKEKRRKIEYELPRLVANIEKSLYHSRDVVGILEAYRDIAGDELKRELEITIADMRTGNYEVALTRLEARVGSGMLSDITRGLIGVIHGDETGVYWGTLAIKFADYQRQALKREASKVPKKVRRLSMVLLVCFLLVYVVVIGSVLLESLGGLLA